jgi:hypothetical protein
MMILVQARNAQADAFERYTNNVLAQAPAAAGVLELKRLTPEHVAQHSRLLGSAGGCLVVVKTNGGLNCKLIIQMARQRTDTGSTAMALIERFVTYKGDEDRALKASGQGVHLYSGFLFKLDVGQVVPAALGGDLRFVEDKEHGYLEPIGNAKLYLITKSLPGTEANKSGRLTIGDTFEPRHFTGVFKLHDDGRRTARLTLKVEADGQVSGQYVSDQSGREYEVFGKVENPKHRIQFTVRFPQSEQVFTGMMFTRDGKAICGTTKLQEKEFGFFAVRADEQ